MARHPTDIYHLQEHRNYQTTQLHHVADANIVGNFKKKKTASLDVPTVGRMIVRLGNMRDGVLCSILAIYPAKLLGL